NSLLQACPDYPNVMVLGIDSFISFNATGVLKISNLVTIFSSDYDPVKKYIYV
ncbi:3901_t:CDS:1, partial [Funneliformis caledonium]